MTHITLRDDSYSLYNLLDKNLCAKFYQKLCKKNCGGVLLFPNFVESLQVEIPKALTCLLSRRFSLNRLAAKYYLDRPFLISIYQFFADAIYLVSENAVIKAQKFSSGKIGRGKRLGHTEGNQEKLISIPPQSTAFRLTQQDDLENLPCPIAYQVCSVKTATSPGETLSEESYEFSKE